MSAHAASPRSISLEWTRPEDTGETLTSYELYWNATAGSGAQLQSQQQQMHKTIPPREEYLLEQLTPNTVYRIFITARSSRGEGAPSRTVVVKTHPFAPTAPPQDVKVTATSSTTLRVSWKPPPLDARNGDIVKYRVIYEVCDITAVVA